jgi:PTS system fructose-specific IIA component
MSTSSVTQIHQLLRPELVRVGLPGRTKQEVIDGLIDLLREHRGVTDLARRVRQAILAREEVMSTGVGKGLGLPHAKTPALTDTVAAFAVTAQPVDFGAIDNQPVRLVFLLVGPEAAKTQHIRDAFRKRLLEATSPAEILQLFEEGELQLAEQ